MASTGSSSVILAAALLLLGACGGKKELPEVYLLTGKCKVEVSTPHDEAVILIDGIHVGHGRVSSNVPCGEKNVRVELQGYKPYRGYHKVDATRTLLVPVKLEPLKKSEVYALSDKVLEDIRAGKLAKGAVEGGASAPAAAEGEGGGGEAAAEINWEDWS